MAGLGSRKGQQKIASFSCLRMTITCAKTKSKASLDCLPESFCWIWGLLFQELTNARVFIILHATNRPSVDESWRNYVSHFLVAAPYKQLEANN